MAVTPNLNLYKPSREDYISVTRDISENMEKIDTGYGNLQNSISGVDDTIGIVVNGNTSSKNITAGQFVIVKNSTISGVTDGLYTAVNNVASETALVAADLSSSNTGDGGLNALNSKIGYAVKRDTKTVTTSANGNFSLEPLSSSNSIVLSIIVKSPQDTMAIPVKYSSSNPGYLGGHAMSSLSSQGAKANTQLEISYAYIEF